MKAFILKYQLVILGLILVLSIFLRFYKLDKIPDGLYQDETSIGYNAYSILKTGKDEYGKTLPVYFKSFGDQKLPVYIYLTALSEKAFGVNAFAVRFSSAILGSLTILILYFVVKKLTNNTLLSLLSSFFLSITPWHLHFSRAGFEVNIALFFALFGSLCLIMVKEKTRWQPILMVFSIVSFGLSLYSYNVTRLLSPLIALAVIMIHHKEYRRLPLYLYGLAIILIVIVLIPFAYTFFSSAGVSSAGGALITSHDIQARTLEFRSYFIDNPLISKLFFNRWVGMVWVYFENLASLLSGTFFFSGGSGHGNQGIGTSGVFHLFQLPLFLLGIFSLLKVRSDKSKLFIWWAVIALLVLGLSKEVPHATRGYFLVIPVVFISSLGVLYFSQLLKNLSKKLRLLMWALLFLFVSYNIFYYFASYYIRFPIFYAKEWRQQDKAVVTYITQNDTKYDRIIFDSPTDFIYTSYLFYSKYPPQVFYENAKRLPDDSEGFSKVQSFGKIEFKDVDWNKDYRKNRTLIVTTPKNKPNEVPILKAFYFPTRPVVVSLKEELFEYPVTDTPYVLVEGRK